MAALKKKAPLLKSLFQDDNCIFRAERTIYRLSLMTTSPIHYLTFPYTCGVTNEGTRRYIKLTGEFMF